VRFTSTEQDIKSAVNVVVFDLRSIDFFGSRFQLFNPEIVSNPVLKSALTRLKSPNQDPGLPGISRSGIGLIQEAETLLQARKKFVVKDECLDSAGMVRDASTEFKLGAEICYNKRTLSTLSPSDLRFQILALTAHEILHHLQGEPKNTEEAAIFVLWRPFLFYLIN
jgi:hypothetical protein